ncbi:MAG: bifunctional oligoribonuclease/PAP phosphatase NrnA [Chloroflexota bacterium]
MFQFAIEKADTVLVITHVDPDGDAIGSLTATGQALEQMGKRVTLACEDNVPARFRNLPLADRVTKTPDTSTPYDLLVVVDCGDESRMGRPYFSLPEPKPTITNIDHHITNTQFGEFNLVDPQASSTAEVLYRLFTELEVTITRGIAESLLTGMITDTLGFRTSNVTANTLRTAADLVKAGAEIAPLTLTALVQKPYSTALIWQVGLKNMQSQDGLIWTTVPAADVRRAGLEGSPSSSGLVNFLSDIEGATMGCVLTEMPDGSVRVGMRCHEPYNVAEIALQFGGGGHTLAAGCTMDGPLEEAETRMVAACQEAIHRQTAALAGNVR